MRNATWDILTTWAFVGTLPTKSICMLPGSNAKPFANSEGRLALPITRSLITTNADAARRGQHSFNCLATLRYYQILSAMMLTMLRAWGGAPARRQIRCRASLKINVVRNNL